MSNEGPAANNAEQFKIPFLVGVTGHRDLLPVEVPAIRAAVEELLRALCAAAPEVQIVVLSSMAEGADLLVADVACELGLQLMALLPYSAARCRADLVSDAGRASFDRVLVNAERLELPLPDGVSEQTLASDSGVRDRQYQSAGAVVARYSSLLIAIWDGQETEHAAGTARVVDYRRRGVSGDDLPRPPRLDLLLGAADNDLSYEIRCSRLRPAAEHGERGIQVLGFTSNEQRQGAVSNGLPSALLTLLKRTGDFNRDVDQYGGQIARHGRRLQTAMPYATPHSLVYIDRLFTSADWLGVHFRWSFTRALRARYALWAVLALLLMGFKKQHEGIGGLLSILGVLLIFGLGWLLALWAHRRNWQRRYLDYRALAEGLRVEFYWELSGVRAQFEGEFAHESFLQNQDVELEWIRAAMRAVSLRCALQPPVALPNGFAHTFAAWVGDPDPVNGSGQLFYYRQRAQALARRQHIAEGIARAMLFGGLLLGVVLAVVAALALHGPVPVPPALHGLMLWSLALLTVYGAIFEIYLGEKADRALIRQYRYMDSLFSFAAREMRSARSEADKLEILRSLGHACLAEHAQWILAHRDKRIEGMRW